MDLLADVVDVVCKCYIFEQPCSHSVLDWIYECTQNKQICPVA